MARVTISEVLPNSTSDVTVPNTAITSWNTQSADVGVDNVRDEGIGRAQLVVGCITPSAQRPAQVTDATVILDDLAWAIFGTVQTAPIAFDGTSAAKLLVHATIDWHAAIDSVSSPSAELRVRIAVSTNGGGAWTAIARTKRIVSPMITLGATSHRESIGSFAIATRSTITTNEADVRFQLQYEVCHAGIWTGGAIMSAEVTVK